MNAKKIKLMMIEQDFTDQQGADTINVKLRTFQKKLNEELRFSLNEFERLTIKMGYIIKIERLAK